MVFEVTNDCAAHSSGPSFGGVRFDDIPELEGDERQCFRYEKEVL